jgi:hypothetical protein
MGALQGFAECSAPTLPSIFEDTFETMALVEALYRSSERPGGLSLSLDTHAPYPSAHERYDTFNQASRPGWASAQPASEFARPAPPWPSLLLHTSNLCDRSAVSIPKEIEWTGEVSPPQTDPHLLNVFLLGDSITRSYYLQVTKDLAGVASVYLMSSPTTDGDSRLPQQIAAFDTLENVSFAVVHFNNACTDGSTPRPGRRPPSRAS